MSNALLPVNTTSSKHAPTPVEVATIQAPADICWMVLGLAAAVCNLIMVVTISTTGSLRTKSLILVASLAFVDTCRSLSYVAVGLKRYLVYRSRAPEMIDPLLCALRTSPQTLVAMVSGDLKLALSIDRLLAMVAPAHYQKLPLRRYIAIVNVAAWSHGFFHASMALIGYSPAMVLGVCTGLSSFNAWFSTYSSAKSFILTSSTICVYVASLVVLRKRMRGMRNMSHTQKTEERQKLELGVFRALLGVLIGYVCTTAVGTTAYVLGPYLAPDQNVLMGPFLALFYIFDCASHLIIFLLLNSSFKRALVNLIRKVINPAQNSVSSVSWKR